MSFVEQRWKVLKTSEKMNEYLSDLRMKNVLKEGSTKSTIDWFIHPSTPYHVRKFFDLMETHIKLVFDGMGGAGLRESKEGMIKILEENGYEYEFYESFITNYENKLMSQYYEKREKDKESK